MLRPVLTTHREEDRLARLESIIAGATQSIAAYTEQAQARLPFYVQSLASGTFNDTEDSGIITVKLPGLAAQLVRVVGVLVSFTDLTTGFLQGSIFALGSMQLAPSVGSEYDSAYLTLNGLWTPISYMADTLQQQTIELTANVADGDSIRGSVLVWGEQVPATGMVQ